MIKEMARLRKSLAAMIRWAPVLLLVVTLASLQETSLPEPTSSVKATEPNQQLEASNTSSRAARDVSGFDLFPVAGAAYQEHNYNPSVEDVLEMGLYAAGVTPTHIAVRGTASQGSVRCDWRGTARTAGQRENAIRFWLGKSDTEQLPSASIAEAEFMSHINQMSPRYQDFVSASFLSIARGGLSTDLLGLTCYVDYSASEYLLGAGPNSLTVAYDMPNETRSYELYRRSHSAGEFGPLDSAPLMTEAEYESARARLVLDAESQMADLLEGREGVVMLAPMGAHNAIAIEAWQVVAQWDLQTDANSVVQAVRYGVPTSDPEHTQTLANLKTRITTASTTDAFADERIGNVSGLTQYYRDIGAYGDIAPDDGSTATFTPSQPPEAYSCADGTAVTSPGDNLGLVHDCEVLVDGKDTLRGTGALNWATGTAISSWDGVTTAGTPTRVTKVELDNESLTGSIPAGLGTLFELTHLDLSSNSLTGGHPP